MAASVVLVEVMAVTVAMVVAKLVGLRAGGRMWVMDLARYL